MSDYTPDKWVILEISSEKNGTYRKILSSWYGGYLGKDEWRLSSQILNSSENENYFQFTTESGSIYNCCKKTYGMNLLASGYYYKIIEQSKNTDIKVSLIDFTELENKQ